MKESQVGVHKGVREAYLERVCVGIRERKSICVGERENEYV